MIQMLAWLASKAMPPLLISFGLLPAAMLPVMMMQPVALSGLAGMPAAFTALTLVCGKIPGRFRLFGGLLSVGILAVLARLILPLTETPALWLIPVVFGGVFLWNLQWSGSRQEIPVAVSLLGVIAYGAAQMYLFLAQRREESWTGMAATLLMTGFLVFAAAAVLTFNRNSLENAAHHRGGTPRSMGWMNRALTLLLLAAGVVIAAIPAIGRIVAAAWQSLLRLIMQLAALLMSLWPEETVSAGGGLGVGAAGLMMGEAGEPGWLAQMIEKVLAGLALLVTLAGLIFLSIRLFRLIRRLIAYLWQRLNRMAAAIGEDYEDEITDTRDDAERSRSRERWSKLPFWRDERRMTPSQRVRYRYGRQRARHPEWRGAATARETLPREAAEIYERVRYGGQEATLEEAEAFIRQAQE